MSQNIDDQVILTPDGHKKLVELLEHLKKDHRAELQERMKSQEKSVLMSDDSEYEDLKKEQAMLESRISHLDSILKRSKVLTPGEISTDRVGIGSRVKVKNLKTKEEEEYVILSSMETNPGEGRISDASPVGRALMRAKKGDMVTADTPRGSVKYLLVSIKK
ncbi:MAG TPA: transcription elongation factor GreA [bacterium]|nr:transcription elongation factor GreA [bacterium]